MMPNLTILQLAFWLVLAFAAKHLIADFFLQNSYMLGKFRERGWVLPLAAHAAVHAGFTFAIILLATEGYGIIGGRLALTLAVVDFVAHFLIDRLTASPKLLGRFKQATPAELGLAAHDIKHFTNGGLADCDPAKTAVKRARRVISDNAWYWRVLGLDQFLHAVTDAYIVFTFLTWVLS